jgi:hypothetical protein
MLAVDDRSRLAAPTYLPLMLLVCALAAGIALDRWLAIAHGRRWLRPRRNLAASVFRFDLPPARASSAYKQCQHKLSAIGINDHLFTRI